MQTGHYTSTRRAFLGATAAAGVFALGRGAVSAQGEAAPLRVGLVGCGRRGLGAARDCVQSSPNVVITAAGELFEDVMADARPKLAQLGDACTVSDETAFTGFDAYQKVIAAGVDVVLLCAPPGFRPQHLDAAVAAGKHVFMEKPCAVCPAGVKAVFAASDRAAEKGLAIVCGTQRRHDDGYREILRQVHDGAIGDIVAASCYWVGGYSYYPAVLRQEGWSDIEAMIRNWNYFTWLSGDHIVEQHIHNIDIMNWALEAVPDKAIGLGGRQQRTGPEYGHIYDHFAVEFEYPGGVRVTSLCRQQSDCVSRVTEHLVGTKGTATPASSIEGENAYTFSGDAMNPFVQEHAHLIASIRAGEPINEGRQLAESTLAAIMGRMAAYTGQEVTRRFLLEESTLNLMPPVDLDFGPMETPPVAVPGVTPLV